MSRLATSLPQICHLCACAVLCAGKTGAMAKCAGSWASLYPWWWQWWWGGSAPVVSPVRGPAGWAWSRGRQGGDGGRDAPHGTHPACSPSVFTLLPISQNRTSWRFTPAADGTRAAETSSCSRVLSEQSEAKRNESGEWERHASGGGFPS